MTKAQFDADYYYTPSRVPSATDFNINYNVFDRPTNTLVYSTAIIHDQNARIIANTRDRNISYVPYQNITTNDYLDQFARFALCFVMFHFDITDWNPSIPGTQI